MACATPQPPQIITEYEVLKLTRKVFVPIRDDMTAPLDVPYVPEGDVDTIDLRTTLGQCQTTLRTCNGRLGGIASVEGTVVTEDPE